MNNTILTQTFEGNDIRVTTVNDVVYFVGKDVAEVLEYSNTNQAISNLVWDEYKGVYGIDTLGGTQQMVCISEQGVYQLVFASKKPEARKFQRWVIEDVLPSIRQTGSFSIQQVPQSHLEITLQTCQAMVEMERKQKELQLVISAQQETIQAIESRTEKFDVPEGYETVNGYLASLTNCSVSSGRNKATQRIGSYLHNNGYSKHSSKVFDVIAGREVNAWEIGAVEDAIKNLIRDADLIVYQGTRGKPQVKTFAEVQQVKRMKKRYTPTEALDLLFSLTPNTVNELVQRNVTPDFAFERNPMTMPGIDLD